MNRLILSCFAAVLVSSSPCIGQGTFQFIHITFNGPPAQPPGTAMIVHNYYEGDLWFRSLPRSDGFVRSGGGTYGYPENGTAYLQAALGGSLLFSFQNDSLFGLVAVDLAGYSDIVPDFTVNFVGYRSDGSIITTSFSGSGIDFQTYHFGPEWSWGLARAVIPNYAWSLDNLVIAIPEPSACALFAFGAIFLATRLLRRMRQ